MRYEQKLVLEQHQLDALTYRLSLQGCLLKKLHPPREVNNLYFDSWDMSDMQEHISGVLSRSKYRVRWYDNDQQNMKFEVKIKNNQLGWKERYPIQHKIAWRKKWTQITRELAASLPESFRPNFLLKCHPVLINNYHREYFVIANKDCRLTIDSELNYYSQRMSPYPNTVRGQSDDRLVLEIKCDRENHNSIKSAMKHINGSFQSYSKYLEGYRLANN